MRIAVLTDIHGNYIALEACLKHAKEQKIDRYVFLGDYLGEFPYPQKTMEIIYDLNSKEDCLFIRGNKEDYWLNRKNNIDCEWVNGNHSISSMTYCYENITEKDLSFFEKMPISMSVTFENMPPILFCHGTPFNNRGKLLPDNESTNDLLKDIQESYVVCGHSHVQRNFYSNNKQVINVGAVGVALSGKGNVAQYAVFDSYSGEWTFKAFDIQYDTNKVERELHDSGLFALSPYWSRITIHLIKTGTISHGTVLSEAMNHNGDKDAWYNLPDEDWEAALAVFGIE